MLMALEAVSGVALRHGGGGGMSRRDVGGLQNDNGGMTF